MKKLDVPPHMMTMLRGRFAHDMNDLSRDALILKDLTPVEVVRACAGWKLGDPRWADAIAGWMRAVGAKPEDF